MACTGASDLQENRHRHGFLASEQIWYVPNRYPAGLGEVDSNLLANHLGKAKDSVGAPFGDQARGRLQFLIRLFLSR